MEIVGIVSLKAGADGNAIAPLLANEARGVWTRLRSGFIRSIKHRADDIPGVVLTMEADSVEQARTLVQTLPLLEKGLIEIDMIPVRAYDGFELLFKDE